jgi:hypothetical protein
LVSVVTKVEGTRIETSAGRVASERPIVVDGVNMAVEGASVGTKRAAESTGGAEEGASALADLRVVSRVDVKPRVFEPDGALEGK